MTARAYELSALMRVSMFSAVRLRFSNAAMIGARSGVKSERAAHCMIAVASDSTSPSLRDISTAS